MQGSNHGAYSFLIRLMCVCVTCVCGTSLFAGPRLLHASEQSIKHNDTTGSYGATWSTYFVKACAAMVGLRLPPPDRARGAVPGRS
jgi:hypothetical protein